MRLSSLIRRAGDFVHYVAFKKKKKKKRKYCIGCVLPKARVLHLETGDRVLQSVPRQLPPLLSTQILPEYEA